MQSCANDWQSDLGDEQAPSPTQAVLFELSVDPGSFLTPALQIPALKQHALFSFLTASLGDFTFKLLMSAPQLNQRLIGFETENM